MSQTYCNSSSYTVSMFAITMIAIMAIVAINSDDNDEPISEQERQLKDLAWQENQKSFFQTIETLKLPLGALGLLVFGLVIKKAHDSHNNTLLVFLIFFAVVGGLYYFVSGGNLSLQLPIQFPIQTTEWNYGSIDYQLTNNGVEE